MISEQIKLIELKEGYYIMIKGSTHQEHIVSLNMCEKNNRTSKQIKKNWYRLKNMNR